MEGKERSAEWHNYHSPENEARRTKELNEALSEVFGWKNKGTLQ